MSAPETRLDPDYTAGFGVAEAHAAFLQHKRDRGGSCATIAFSIPETPRGKVEAALAQARSRRVRVVFICNTADQAQEMRALAARLLPDHRPVALDRAASGAWGPQ